MTEFEFCGRHFLLNPSPRCRRVSFLINSDGRPEFRVPPDFTVAETRQMLQESPDFWRRILRILERVAHSRISHEFKEGETFFLFGTPRQLKFSCRILAVEEDCLLLPRSSPEETRNLLTELFRRQLLAYLPEKLDYWSKHCNIEFAQWRVTSASTRWGSCSSLKHLSFSWRLAQCPAELIDYVVVHELTHCLIMAHSPKFWRQLESFLPGAELRRRQLKIFGRQCI